VKKSSACMDAVRRVTSLVSALMKMIGIFLVAGWRRQNFADGQAVEVRQQDVEQDQSGLPSAPGSGHGCRRPPPEIRSRDWPGEISPAR